MSQREIRIGLCGFGVVGQGVYHHLRDKEAELTKRLGLALSVTRIAVRDLGKKRDFEVDASILTTDPMSIATDPDVDIVCELMGGTDLALDVMIAALKAGKAVATANKALLCDHGEEVFAAAEEGGGRVLFEASVAGGIPVIKALNEGLVINRFSCLYGILNGTCNYILTRMANEGGSYESILKEAKELGYAEADEALDVDGIDAAHKAVVLAYLAYGKWVSFKNVLVTGISALNQEDFQYAEENGYAIKLVAVIDRTSEEKLYISVMPTLVSKKYVLGRVDGVFNAVAIHGDVVGETVYIGPGAGRDATASAVISDVVDAAKLMVQGVSTLSQSPRNGACLELAEPEDIVSRYYVRLVVKDEPGVMAQIAAIFAKREVSLASISQKEVAEDAAKASLIITTHNTSEKAIIDAIDELEKLDSLESKPVCLPVGNFEK